MSTDKYQHNNLELKLCGAEQKAAGFLHELDQKKTALETLSGNNIPECCKQLFLIGS